MSDNLKKFINQLSLKNVDYYLISTSDENLLEYAPKQNMRLKWLTNFTGSNGIALISKNKKFFFTDGRYILQAKKEIQNEFQVLDQSNENILTFIAKRLKEIKLMIDFRLFTVGFIKDLKRIAKLRSIKIYDDKKNIIDQEWKNRPEGIKKKIFHLNEKVSGENILSKKQKLLNLSKYEYLILTSSDSVCWLMNIRGYDLENTPIVFCKAIVTKFFIKLFIDKEKISSTRQSFFKEVKVYSIMDFENELLRIPKNKKTLLDSSSSYFYYDFMIRSGLNPVVADDPCKLIKSQKNKTEIKNAIKFHISDAISLVKFFHWLERQDFNSSLNELNVSKRLQSFREENKYFFSLSFPTISAVGASGSIIHYNPESNSKRLNPGQLYLCDSGAQYVGATTDVTRTILLGENKPKKEYVSKYTKVLIGHINLAMTKFPKGTKGYQIDSIARYSLWQNGLDYNHGTGHGVGSFLGVHEGPQSISKRYSNFELKEGMILSNEPGYYKNANYGIRIENLLLVIQSKFKDFLEFKNLTLFPYEKDLIEIKMLSLEQKNWINKYHLEIYNKLKRFLTKDTKSWLYKKTRSI